MISGSIKLQIGPSNFWMWQMPLPTSTGQFQRVSLTILSADVQHSVETCEIFKLVHLIR